MLRALLVSVLALSVGCSRIFMETLPDDYAADRPPSCTSSTFWPAIDGIGVGLDVAGIVGASRPGVENGDGLIVLHVISGVVGLASMVYGLRKASQCSSAEAQWRGRPTFEVDPGWSAPEPEVDDRLRCAMPTAGSKGVCGRGVLECQQRRKVLRDAGAELGGCVPVATAMCLVAIRGDGRRLDSCFPTTAGCEAQRSLLAAKPDKYSSVSACVGDEATLPDEAVTPTPPATSFHCSEVPEGTAAVCARTAAACQVGRDALLASGADATPCAEVAAAVCFTGASGEHCFPSAGMCQATRDALDDAGATACVDGIR